MHKNTPQDTLTRDSCCTDVTVQLLHRRHSLCRQHSATARWFPLVTPQGRVEFTCLSFVVRLTSRSLDSSSPNDPHENVDNQVRHQWYPSSSVRQLTWTRDLVQADKRVFIISSTFFCCFWWHASHVPRWTQNPRLQQGFVLMKFV